jgi:hypothetical protein
MSIPDTFWSPDTSLDEPATAGVDLSGLDVIVCSDGDERCWSFCTKRFCNSSARANAYKFRSTSSSLKRLPMRDSNFLIFSFARFALEGAAGADGMSADSSNVHTGFSGVLGAFVFTANACDFAHVEHTGRLASLRPGHVDKWSRVD